MTTLDNSLEISVKAVIYASALFVFRRRKAFLRALGIPLIAYVMLFFFIGSDYFYSDPGSLDSFALLSIIVAFHVFVAITTHRLVLLGDNSLSKSKGGSWWDRAFHFLVYGIVVILCPIPVVVLGVFAAEIFGLTPEIEEAIVVILTLLVWARLSLVFPAIATDQFKSLREVWKVSRKYQFSMIGIVFFYPLILSLPIYVILLMLNSLPFVAIYQIVVTVFTVAALSVAYREIIYKEISELERANNAV